MARRASNTLHKQTADSPAVHDGEDLPIKLAPDHIQNLCSAPSALKAIEELIWNALDADANEVVIKLSKNQLDGLQRIVISDNGHGLEREKCKEAFGSLGGSKKRKAYVTPGGRKPHGKYGKGRFKAFALGDIVSWKSRYRENGETKEFSVVGSKKNIQNFKIGTEKAIRAQKTGVTVTIENININRPSLLDADKTILKLTETFALYLRQYPGVSISYGGKKIDPSAVEVHVQDYSFEFTSQSGITKKADLTIIEWSVRVERALFLCDSAGFARAHLQPGIQAPGYEFTAYIKSDLVSELDEEQNLDLLELHPDINALVNNAKTALKDHFRRREGEQNEDVIKQWQEEEVYPYSTDLAADPLEQAERDVFNVCAFKIQEYLPEFEEKEKKQKQLIFKLVKQAVETNPSALTVILQEVMDLSIEQQDEFAQLLERTKLSSVISAASTVTRRLSFLQSLDGLLFDEHKKTLNEPRQLQPILTSELWIFGEEYALGVDEGSLKTALQTHVKLLGREDLIGSSEKVVDIEEGKSRRLDMLLYRSFPSRNKGSFGYLVIELKRPSIKLGQKELNQIKKYATTVMKDDRFDKSERSSWTFLLVGNSVDETVDIERTQDNRPHGQVLSKEGMEIHVKTWGEIIADAKWRYEFFREQLEFEITHDDALAELRNQYPNLLKSSDVATPED